MIAWVDEQCRAWVFKLRHNLIGPDWFRSARVIGFWRVVWYRFGYPRLMRFSHRHGWHHAIILRVDDRKHHWCQWCGLRWAEPRKDLPEIKP